MKKFKFCPMCAAPLTERIKDRFECSAPCGFVNYDNPTPVAAMVVEYEGTSCWPTTGPGKETFTG